jgi:hypothetical protein
VFWRRKRFGPVLAPPYKRATVADGGRWVEESLQRQMFQDAFERDEVQIAAVDARMRIPGADGKPLQARVVATDRALHARVTFGLGIHRFLRLHYDQVKFVEVARPDETDVEVVYFNADRATNETWHLRLEEAPPASGFGATLVQLVSQRSMARTAAARIVEQAWTVPVAEARSSAEAGSAVASEVA